MTTEINKRSHIEKHFDDQKRVEHDVNSYTNKATHQANQDDPYEPLREDLICQLLQEYKTGATVLDVGCGIGHLVKRLTEQSFDCEGFDLSPNMIAAAKDCLAALNQSDKVTCADLYEYQPNKTFDTIIANGVIWYYQDKEPFLERLHGWLHPKGHILIVHRNDLFNLYAMNQGTLDFFTNTLFASQSPEQREYLNQQLQAQHPTIKAPISINSDLKKPYDNPLDIHKLYEKMGFHIQNIAYTYIHPFPPSFMDKATQYPYEALQKQYGRSWQGAFMGSQFIVVAQKK